MLLVVGETLSPPSACGAECVTAAVTRPRRSRCSSVSLSRRQLLLGTAAVAATRPTLGDALPAPKSCGIDHIVVVLMENRSFDHMLGWVPHADGRQAGMVYHDDHGHPHRTHRL